MVALALVAGVVSFAPAPALASSQHAGSHSPRAHTAGNWNLSEQQLVVRDGLMAPLPSEGFAGAKPLSVSAAGTALKVLAEHDGVAPIHFDVGSPLTVLRFDKLLVQQLGLDEVAAHVQLVAAGAGLSPPSYFGSEVVARYLGLRYEHPVGEQRFDLYPSDPITRAEAAHSLAVLVDASASWELAAAREELLAFSLPRYTPDQLRVLRIAVSKIGMPYVWGGTTDGTEDGLEHGGYDCSGFVWRVYKVSGLPWGAQIGGRTAAQQAGEIPRSQRIRMNAVQPADLLFFGSAHFNAKATEANVIHEGLALGDGWVIHSSAQGVYVLPLTQGWLHESFTWARRVL